VKGRSTFAPACRPERAPRSPLPREEFGEHLQSIGQRGSDGWGRVAQGAADLKPDQPLPADVMQPMRELVEFQRPAAAELAELNPPEEADEEVEMLIEALRERTVAFEQALEAGRFTRLDFDQITEWGTRSTRPSSSSARRTSSRRPTSTRRSNSRVGAAHLAAPRPIFGQVARRTRASTTERAS
jgi:hypothetical protein